jgi:hypothetical protein
MPQSKPNLRKRESTILFGVQRKTFYVRKTGAHQKNTPMGTIIRKSKQGISVEKERTKNGRTPRLLGQGKRVPVQ